MRGEERLSEQKRSDRELQQQKRLERSVQSDRQMKEKRRLSDLSLALKSKRAGSNLNAIILASLTMLISIDTAQAQTLALTSTNCGDGNYLFAADFSGSSNTPSGACAACPPGTKCTGSPTAPVDCEPGQYSEWGSSTCTDCPAGWKCPSPGALPEPCPISQYSPGKTTTCFDCNAGMDCKPDGSADGCTAGQYCPGQVEAVDCAAGYKCDGKGSQTLCTAVDGYATYSEAGSATCHICPRGHFCPHVASAPIECGAGFYNNMYGKTTCTICPTGFYCPDTLSDKLKYPKACEAGFYASSQGTVECEECPAGFKCDKVSITECEDGSYSPAGKDKCYPCPPGYSCTADAKTPCATGYSKGGEVFCRQCPSGHECPRQDYAPMECKPGYYSLPGNDDCTECPLGHFCEDPTRYPSKCPEGYTALTVGQYRCEPTPAGLIMDYSLAEPTSTNCTASNQISNQYKDACMDCPAGYACPDGTFDRMVPCSSGYYSIVGDIVCHVSPAGFYAPTTLLDPTEITDPLLYSDIGMTFAETCPWGQECRDRTGRHMVLCPPGYYNDPTTTVCTECEEGKYCPPSLGERLTEGIACVDGTYSGPGYTECFPCKPGYACADHTLSGMTACDPGFFQVGGTMTCEQCPVNHECNDDTSADNTGNTPIGETVVRCPAFHYMDPNANEGSCVPCPDGKECQGYALEFDLEDSTNILRDCGPGYYSRALDFFCMPCPKGHYCESTNNAVPVPCTGNTYSDEGATTCLACATGYYAKMGSEYCSPVPAGFEIIDGGTDDEDIAVCEQGTYSKWGQETCVTCKNGFLCPEGSTEGDAWQNSCPRGSYCFEGVQTKCPAGTYGTMERAYLENVGCATCPAGYNCQPGTANFELVPCPKGGYCPEGSSVIPCPANTFNEQIYGRSKSDCKTCPAGHECGLMTVDRGTSCPAGKYCPRGYSFDCPAGTHGASKTGKRDVGECLPCPPGHYCEEGSGAPTESPAGFYTKLSGIPSADALYLCPPGYYCPDTAMTDYLGYHCQAGYVCPAGSVSATEKPCPSGTFSDRRDLHDVMHCDTCPKGFYCPEASTSAEVTPCPANTYCPPGSREMGEVFDCPAGTYAPYTGSTSAEDCLPCPPGSYCLAGAGATICDIGYYCPEGTSSAYQYPCPLGLQGTQQGLHHQSQCERCGAGFYCPTAGSTPQPCGPGYYNDITDGAFCKVCAAGFYCPDALNIHPKPCLAQTYSAAGAIECVVCPAGHYCPNEGTTDAELADQKCPKGTLCLAQYDGALDGVTVVSLSDVGIGIYPNKLAIADGGHACPEYKYCPKGATEAIDIPIGTMQQTFGRGDLNEAIQSPPGFYTASNNDTNDEFGVPIPEQPYIVSECPVGNYCPAGSYVKIGCPKGTYRNTVRGQDVNECGQCPSGTYCPDEQMSDPLDCPMGHFCPQGSINPQKCPIGTYNPGLNLRDSRGCTPCDSGSYCPFMGQEAVEPDHLCDAGFYCIEGSSRPEPTDNTTGKICPIGGYCLEGTTSPSACAAGLYGPYIGAKKQEECHTCTPGYYCPGANAAEARVICEANYYCELGSSALGTAPVFVSDEGHYAVTGSAFQQPCERGYYQDQTLQSSCISCPAGLFCDSAGLFDTDAIICPQGYYCPSYLTFQLSSEANKYRAIPCPKGTYGDRDGLVSASECTDCPPGMFCDQPGMDTVPDPVNQPAEDVYCAAGYYCTSGSPERFPFNGVSGSYGPCPAGYWCPEGTEDAYANACPQGTFNPQEGSTSDTFCIDCPPGYLCTAEGLSAPLKKCDTGKWCEDGLTQTPCSATTGQYCPLATYHPQWCPFGLYQDSTSRGYCKMCSAGNYCMNGLTQQCETGYYCPNDLQNTIPS